MASKLLGYTIKEGPQYRSPWSMTACTAGLHAWLVYPTHGPPGPAEPPVTLTALTMHCQGMKFKVVCFRVKAPLTLAEQAFVTVVARNCASVRVAFDDAGADGPAASLPLLETGELAIEGPISTAQFARQLAHVQTLRPVRRRCNHTLDVGGLTDGLFTRRLTVEPCRGVWLVHTYVDEQATLSALDQYVQLDRYVFLMHAKHPITLDALPSRSGCLGLVTGDFTDVRIVCPERPQLALFKIDRRVSSRSYFFTKSRPAVAAVRASVDPAVATRLIESLSRLFPEYMHGEGPDPYNTANALLTLVLCGRLRLPDHVWARIGYWALVLAWLDPSYDRQQC